MKASFAWLLGAILAASLSRAAPGTAQTVSYRTILSPRGYALLLPADWQAFGTTDASVGSAFTSPAADARMVVLTQGFSSPPDPLTSIQTTEAADAAVPGFSGSEPQAVDVQGAQGAYELDETYTGTDGAAWNKYYLLAARGNALFTLVLTETSAYDAARPDDVGLIAGSFQLVGSVPGWVDPAPPGTAKPASAASEPVDTTVVAASALSGSSHPLATAQCRDGQFSFKQTPDALCAGHGGILVSIVPAGEAANIAASRAEDRPLAPSPTPTAATRGRSASVQVIASGCWNGSIVTSGASSQAVQGCGDESFPVTLQGTADSLTATLQSQGTGLLSVAVSCGGTPVTQTTNADYGSVTATCHP